MKKYITSAIVVLGVSSASFAETPEDVVNRLFDGMRAGDGSIIRELVVPDARLDRLQPDGTLRQGTFDRWINWVDQQENGDANEQIFGVETMSQSEELATVWAPFDLHYKGELVGCGVNQFTLAKTGEGWRVLYGIDMHSQDDCSTFRDQFKD